MSRNLLLSVLIALAAATAAGWILSLLFDLQWKPVRDLFTGAVAVVVVILSRKWTSGPKVNG